LTAKITIIAIALVAGMSGQVIAAEPANWSQSTASTLKQAQRGDTLAQLIIGDAYLHGEGVTRDPAEGMRWLLKAANAGFDQAETEVAGIYFRGDGVPRNVGQAIRWEKRIAARGGPLAVMAESSLGAIYLKGDGVPSDVVTAADWYRKAADHGSQNAALQLAQLYEHGVGDGPDLVQSYMWYLVLAGEIDTEQMGAASKSWVGAIKQRREAVGARLTGDERKSAEELARRYKSKGA
jgi:TPR repeat protein